MGATIFTGPGCCQTTTSVSATPQGWFVEDNRVDLRALPSSPANKFCALQGLVDRGDGLGGIYTWYNDNEDADDGVTVLEPDDSTGAGRWIKLL